MLLIWTDEAWDDYLYWQSQDKKTLKRINNIIKDIQRNGASNGIGMPEPLRGNLADTGHVVLTKKTASYTALRATTFKTWK